MECKMWFRFIEMGLSLRREMRTATNVNEDQQLRYEYFSAKRQSADEESPGFVSEPALFRTIRPNEVRGVKRSEVLCPLVRATGTVRVGGKSAVSSCPRLLCSLLRTEDTLGGRPTPPHYSLITATRSPDRLTAVRQMVLCLLDFIQRRCR
ncbi:hypothetical protein J6590_013226 [Homalodisca vitripennis]|nr:hypothetical protein J6590_013226 [Homalodisca vitripennis]